MEETELCKLAYKYGTDKCPRLKHPYTPIYYEMLKDKQQSIKKVLEFGIGYYKNMGTTEIVEDKQLKRFYHKGASLKMWRDFFPNAQIYGADKIAETLFKDERIHTFQCNEKVKGEVEGLIALIGSDIDFFVDDASHRHRNQIALCLTVMPLLKKDVIYVIEDAHSRSFKHFEKYLSVYDCEFPKFDHDYRDNLVIVKNKV